MHYRRGYSRGLCACHRRGARTQGQEIMNRWFALMGFVVLLNAQCSREPQRITIHLTATAETSPSNVSPRPLGADCTTDPQPLISEPKFISEPNNPSVSTARRSGTPSKVANISLVRQKPTANRPAPAQTRTTIKTAPNKSRNTLASVSLGKPPVAVPVTPKPVLAQPGRPAVPPEIQKDFAVDAPPANLQLRLQRTRKSRMAWENRRALIEDQLSGEVRSYAIGDLLPRGAVLVGIQPREIRVMTRNSLVIAIRVGRKPNVLSDLRQHKKSGNRVRRSTLSDVLIATVQAAVENLKDNDGHLVVRAVEKLVGEGQMIAPLLAEYAASTDALAIRNTRVGQRRIISNTLGQRVIAILEHITGQSFGNPTRANAQAEIAQAWRDWAGLAPE
ncbi:MAG: hypothetical protein KTR25_14450 [Myxococcales bacterium]|nr:hypothetical protein [Myxococcales bacterium]